MARKAYRRIRLLLIVLLGCGLLVGGGWLLRTTLQRNYALKSRDKGLAALDKQDLPAALGGIGTYLQRYPDDVDAMYKYIQARERVPEPNNRHIQEAIALSRHLLELAPQHTAARRELLALYVKAGFNTETVAVADELIAANQADGEVFRAKAMALARLRKFREARLAADQCCGLLPRDLNAQILMLAIMQQANAPHEDILARARTLREAHPNDVRFELLEAIACQYADDRENAVRRMRAASERALADPEVLDALVAQFDGLGLFRDSLELLQNAARQTGDARYQLALVPRTWDSADLRKLVESWPRLEDKASSVATDFLAIRAACLIHLTKADEAKPIIAIMAQRSDDALAKAWVLLLRSMMDSAKADPREFLAMARTAVALDGTNPYFQFFLGNAYAALGEGDLAVAAWTNAARQSPGWGAPWTQMARLRADAGQNRAALAAARAAAQRAPRSVSAAIALALAWANLLDTDPPGPVDDLLSLVRTIQEAAPHEPYTLAVEVWLLVREGHRDEAVQIMKKAIAADPAPSRVALLHWAQVSLALNLDLDQACFQRCAEVHGMSAELAYAQADRLADRQRPADGMALLMRAMPQPPDIRWRLALARYRDLIGDPTAEDTWVALGDSEPADLAVQRFAINAQRAQGNREFIARTITRLHALTGDHGITWQLARARWLLGAAPTNRDLAEASSILNGLIQSSPDLAEPHLLLALCLERLDRLGAAIEQMTTAVSLMPEAPLAQLKLATMFQAAGDFDQARVLLNRLGQLQTASVPVRATSALFMAQQGDAQAALRVLEGAGRSSSQALLLRAALYRRQNQLDKVETICRELLAKPDPAGVRFVCDYYAAQGNIPLARAALDKLAQAPVQEDMKELIGGDFESRHGTSDQALVHYRRAVAAAPRNLLVWRVLLAFHVRHGQSAEALGVLADARSALPQNPLLELLHKHASSISAADEDTSLRHLVLALLNQEDCAVAAQAIAALADIASKPPAQAALALVQLADRNPRHLALQLTVIEKLLTMNRPADAVPLATRSAQMFPNSEDTARLAALSLAACNRWSEALVMARQWRDRCLDQPLPADLLIATIQISLTAPQQAVRQLSGHIERAAGNPQQSMAVLSLYARALILSGRPADAASLLRPLLPKSAACRGLWLILASDVVRDTGMAAEWLDQFTAQSLELPPEEQVAAAVAWYRLGQRSHVSAHCAKARTLLQAICNAPAAAPSALLRLAIIEEQESNPSAAAVLYRRVLSANPDQALALNNLAMILAGRDDTLDEALRLASRAVQVSPRVATFHDTLAFVQSRRKDYAQAIAAVTVALRLEPNRPEWQISLARIHAERGQWKQAKAVLDQIPPAILEDQTLPDSVRQSLAKLRAQVTAHSGSSALEP